MEKMSFRSDGKRRNADRVLDVVRGLLIMEDLDGFIRCLDVLQQHPDIKVG